MKLSLIRWSRPFPPKGTRLLSVLAVLAACELAILVVLVRAADREAARCDHAGRRVRALTDRLRAASDEASQQAELDRLVRCIRDLEQALCGAAMEPSLHEETAEPQLAVSQGYFAIMATVERIRAEARRQGVECGERDYFGFGLYAQAGPPPELAPAVHAQRRAAERILRLVLGCGFDRLVKVERMPPRPTSARPPGSRPNEAASPGTRDELFVPEPPLLGGLETVRVDWLRVTLDGDSAALRRLLRRCAEDVTPIWIRAVEWEPLPGGSEPTMRGSAAASARAARSDEVGAPRVRFTVTCAVGGTIATAGGETGGGGGTEVRS